MYRLSLLPVLNCRLAAWTLNSVNNDTERQGCYFHFNPMCYYFITSTVACLGIFHVNLYFDPGIQIRGPGSGRYLKTLSGRIFWLLSRPRGNATIHEFCRLFYYYVVCVFPCQRPLGTTLTYTGRFDNGPIYTGPWFDLN